MKPIKHAIISAGLGVLIILWLKSFWGAFACLLSGVFIDIDHHLDYYIAKKKFPWTYRELVNHCEKNQTGKLYLIFHSYELLMILWIIVFVYKLDTVYLSIAIGLSIHLLCDQFSNKMKPLAYFTFYRMCHRFNKEKMKYPGVENVH